MLHRFKNHIHAHFPHLREARFLLACSGGLDSVVLAHLCWMCQLDFTLAHCNFQLRGRQSDQDEEFVRQLATAMDRKIFITHFQTRNHVAQHKLTVQVAARELRYAWFAEIMAEHGILTLVTAHHADDSLETFLINLSRGSGVDGLSGIPAQTDTLSRPLLIFSREEILAYAQDQKLTWREDGSNADTKYLRNNIRHTIVPHLKALHPTFLANFLKSQEYVRDTAHIAQEHVQQLRNQVFITDGEVEKVNISLLLALHPVKTYLFYFFREYGFKQWDDIYSLLMANSGKEVHSPTHRLLRDREYLLLKKRSGPAEGQVHYIGAVQELWEGPIRLRMETVDHIGEMAPTILYVDKETLKYPLLLRKWKKGDYFCPFGMNGTKKISKFYKDSKMDAFSKESQWLLCSDNEVVWIVGKRPDNRFRITEGTKKILKMIWEQ